MEHFYGLTNRFITRCNVTLFFVFSSCPFSGATRQEPPKEKDPKKDDIEDEEMESEPESELELDMEGKLGEVFVFL